MKSNSNNPLAPLRASDPSVMELRREPRLPAHLPSVVIDNDSSIYTTIINMSSEGIGLLSARPLTEGSVVDLQFEYRGNEQIVPVTLKVTVRYCIAVEDEYYIGGHLDTQPLEFVRFFHPNKKE